MDSMNEINWLLLIEFCHQMIGTRKIRIIPEYFFFQEIPLENSWQNYLQYLQSLAKLVSELMCSLHEAITQP